MADRERGLLTQLNRAVSPTQWTARLLDATFEATVDSAPGGVALE